MRIALLCLVGIFSCGCSPQRHDATLAENVRCGDTFPAAQKILAEHCGLSCTPADTGDTATEPGTILYVARRTGTADAVEIDVRNDRIRDMRYIPAYDSYCRRPKAQRPSPTRITAISTDSQAYLLENGQRIGWRK